MKMPYILPLLGLLLALTACATAETPQAKVPVAAERSWRLDDGTTRSLLLTVSDDGSARLFTRGPARSVPHWGELDYPETLVFGGVHRIDDRTFLVFPGENAQVVEIAERSADRLAVWFRRDLAAKADIEAELRRLPAIARAPDMELVLLPVPTDRKPTPLPAPSTRFAI